jgi:hypothetical protein
MNMVRNGSGVSALALILHTMPGASHCIHPLKLDGPNMHAKRLSDDATHIAMVDGPWMKYSSRTNVEMTTRMSDSSWSETHI